MDLADPVAGPSRGRLGVARGSEALQARQRLTARVAAGHSFLLVGVFGGEIVSHGVTSDTRVPVAVVLAFFAVFGTLAVARHGFRGGDSESARLRVELEDERERRRRIEGQLEQLTRDVAELRAGDREDVDRQAPVGGA